MIVTNHAKKRLKERNGFSKNTAERMADKAFKEGIKHSETKGSLNRWVTNLYFMNESANNIRLYGDKAYIFCGETLVTVIQIPANLMKNMKKMIKEKNIEN